MLLNSRKLGVFWFFRIMPKRLFFRLLLAIALVCAAAVCNVVLPIILKKIIDILAKTHDFGKVWELFVFFSLALFLGRLFFEAKFVVYAKWEQALIKNGFDYVYKHVQYNTPEFFKTNLSGAITSRIFQSMLGLKVLLFDSIFHMLPLLVEFLLILVTLAVVFDKQIMLTIGIGILLYGICLLSLNNKLLTYQNEIRNSTIDSQGVATNLLNNWKDIKLTNGYKLSNHIFEKTTEKSLVKNLRFYQKRSIFGFVQSLPLSILFIYANYQAIMGYISGVSTIGSLLLINSYLWQLMKPLETVGVLFRGISRSYTDYTSIALILKGEQEHCVDNDSLPVSSGQLCIQNLSEKNILNNINISLESGDKIAIIGESGAGKTTLLNIISGLDTNYSGRVLLNGMDIRHIPVNELRRNITLLANDSKIINGTIKENLLLGDYSDAQAIMQALAYACIDSKIRSLPKGIETFISEDSNILSTGEMQRIKLARTFLLNGDIKVFDESTSAMDVMLEEKIINNILADKASTVIFITHRLSHLSKFDKIFFMKKGKIIENGYHDQLIETRGEYFELWKNQSQSNSLQVSD